ncbi:AraC family transcriptional regulator [Jiangella sp. DSM 45060]|uniref:AraC family transcriptional regulator n=1 Tax=Jiangella sp. DSM 45060 TaxID=1798224 RepID=UPI00087A4124|nr:AraC family transcriptional regulator [Jiangella sp. DSM 45060]SDT50684.1 AraC-type DNA-binding protein [Jiangella sp. DSM 45060]
MTRPPAVGGARFEDYGHGLSAFTFRRHVDSHGEPDLRDSGFHTHLEIEIHLVESGEITLDCAGLEVRLVPGDVLAFWGGVPHRDVDPKPPLTVYHVAQVPIVNVLAWASSAPVLGRLLDGELVKLVPSPGQLAVSGLDFARWSADVAGRDPHLMMAAEMELHALLLRLLHHTPGAAATVGPRVNRAAANVVANAIRYVTRHFGEHITVDDVARAVGRNRDHLTTTFQAVCGITVKGYVVRLRLAEARRLLTATDLPIRAVGHRSGFGSTARLYEAFRSHYGMTPAMYRRQALIR